MGSADRDRADLHEPAVSGELCASPAYRAAHPNGEPNTAAHAVQHQRAFTHANARSLLHPDAAAADRFAISVAHALAPEAPGAHSHPDGQGDARAGDADGDVDVLAQ